MDWYAVLTELTARTPAGLTASSFTGTSGAATSTPATAGATPGGIGTVTVSVTGTYASDIHFSPVAEVDRQPVGITILLPAPGGTGSERKDQRPVHRELPIHCRTTARREPFKERELLMDQLKRFVWPIATGGSVLVIALIALTAWIGPEGNKVSTADANKTILLSQETSLQAEISSLAHESANEPKNCSACART